MLTPTVGRLLEEAEDLLVAVASIAEREGFDVQELLDAIGLIREWKDA